VSECGHKECCICLRKTCNGVRIKLYGEFFACDDCVARAIEFTNVAASKFGGTRESECGMAMEERK